MIKVSTNLSKQFFEIIKWTKNAKKRITSQIIILLSKKWNKTTMKTHKKFKFMFEIYFSFSLVIFKNDIEEVFYSLLTNNKKTIINQK